MTCRIGIKARVRDWTEGCQVAAAAKPFSSPLHRHDKCLPVIVEPADMMERMALTWLVVGIGDISTKRILPAILAEPHSRLAGIVTRDPAKAAPYGVPSWESLEAALAGCPAETVYIATPVFVHAAQTIAALLGGRHVLCEKPMAMDYQQALTMQQAAEENGRTLGISYYRRMYPKVERARALLAAGAIEIG